MNSAFETKRNESMRRAAVRPGRRGLHPQLASNCEAGPCRSFAIVSSQRRTGAAHGAVCVGCINSLRPGLQGASTWNDGQFDVRAVVGVKVNPHVGRAHCGRSYFRLAALQIARKVREEGTGNLNANLMA